jgi:hypothetical protein
MSAAGTSRHERTHQPMLHDDDHCNFAEWHNRDETYFGKNSTEGPTEEVGVAEESGVMSGILDCAWVRGYVLNNLEEGPVRVADLMGFGEPEFGFSRGQIQAAGEHFAVIAQDRDGELFWMRPANLFAIWWGVNRDNAFRHSSSRRASRVSLEQVSGHLRKTSR